MQDLTPFLLDSLWSDLRQQVYLGSEHFVEQMQQQVPDGDLTEVPRLQRRGPARPLTEYEASNGRDQAMAAAYRSGDYTMKQIAEHFGVHYATVSRAVSRSEVNGGMQECKT